MALPRKLKNLMLFVDGFGYDGQINSVTLPKLSRKIEAYSAGGMVGAAGIDHGLDDDALIVEWERGGWAREELLALGIPKLDGVLLRFTGSLQREDTGDVDAIEIVMRGRHEEIDRGDAKKGEDTTSKIKTRCVYYKETFNGVTDVEIDVLNMVEIIGGVDRQAQHRRALGR
ncbi:major tail tube protein [Chitiniphilus shinanonensis]|uniref:Major tail tube protein n=1 Tax=Chitiniphilus shinanonensis TaxID=553088 RepID=A0ABQ6BNQ8_9NEIS|nr:phage major tail tube protein [Chitiniphilus shinanonensis]GLS03501.1 major tail tube protein [Chitiniphilus shinanonensis]